jgi:hypothetical protein
VSTLFKARSGRLSHAAVCGRIGFMGRSWTMTDAWVFAAIAHDRPARVHTLAEVIAIADGINHAVLTETAAVGRRAHDEPSERCLTWL